MNEENKNDGEVPSCKKEIKYHKNYERPKEVEARPSPEDN
jgi:hypothetical protein